MHGVRFFIYAIFVTNITDVESENEANIARLHSLLLILVVPILL